MSEGFLTTHILDTAHGCPAAGVEIELFKIVGERRDKLGSMTTNHDGRTDTPILPKGKLEKATYELVFNMGDYFASKGIENDVPFVDVVPIRFGVSDDREHYHVPLLASPFSFSTYRGS